MFGVLAGVVAALGGFELLYRIVRIPEPSAIATAQSALVLDRDGTLVARLHADADRVDIPLRDMPASLRAAVVAAEDRDFYRHPGISPASIARAGLADLLSLRVREGGSTITQQYVKNAFLGRERTFGRKLKEALIALKLERVFSKDQILERYLNTIYLGRGAYGVEAAARTYFGVSARDLTLARSALLAGVIRAPEALDPARAPDAARARRDQVLAAMARAGAAGDAEIDRARAEPVRVGPRQAGGFAPYFVEDVRQDLEARLGPSLYSGGVTVRTTLDSAMQRAAERAVSGVLDRAGDPDAALVAVDPASGEVRALVGGRDFAARQMNLATQGARRSGSAFKPFVLAAALEAGIPVESRYPSPGTLTLRTGSGSWTVHNFDGRDEGTIDMTRATVRSANTYYAQLILKVGPDAVARLARRAGIASRLEAVPSLALGTSDVTPLELTSAYATFAARGVRRPPTMIRGVADREGRMLYSPAGVAERALGESLADRENQVLRAVIEDGTGRGARIGRPAAGKTGTTGGFTDAWFVGYTPDLAAGVWLGYAEGGRTMERVHGARVTGGTLPARIWRAFMLDALRETPPRGFPEPSPTPSAPASSAASAAASPAPSATASPSPSRSSG